MTMLGTLEVMEKYEIYCHDDANTPITLAAGSRQYCSVTELAKLTFVSYSEGILEATSLVYYSE